jgi:hypothetical protein
MAYRPQDRWFMSMMHIEVELNSAVIVIEHLKKNYAEQ